jgi:SAM-dependent methyltransferase
MQHLGGYLDKGDPQTYMPDVWADIIDIYKVRSVVDVGCGAGYNLQWFAERNIDTFGIDGHPDAVTLTKAKGIRAIKHDYTKRPFIAGRYDLGICTEFAEHVHAEYEPNWLATLAMCEVVLFTHALPGQGGYHHVNCQTAEYWHERFAGIGKSVDTILTYRHRDPSAIWGRNTLTVYR